MWGLCILEAFMKAVSGGPITGDISPVLNRVRIHVRSPEGVDRKG